MGSYLKRYLWFICGIIINSFGIVVITKGMLGTSPISSLPFVLSIMFPMTLGQFTFIVNGSFIVLQILLLRRRFPPLQLLQIAVNIIFSLFIDISMFVLSWLNPDFLPIQLIVVVVGCAILGFGICVEVAPNVLLVPGEGLVKAISSTSGIRFGTIKIAFDCTLVVISLTLSLVFLHGIVGLGLGTIITAFIVGRFVNFFNAKVPLIRHIAGLATETTPEMEPVPNTEG